MVGPLYCACCLQGFTIVQGLIGGNYWIIFVNFSIKTWYDTSLEVSQDGTVLMRVTTYLLKII